MKKKESLLQKITEQLNQHEYTDLTKFLGQIDWFSIPEEDIVPREKVRAFIKNIENEETRLNVARFLQKYEEYYFKEPDSGFSANIGPDPIAEFHRELDFLIQQIISNGEFTDDKFSKQVKRITELEKQVNELKKENENLSAQLEKYKHPSRNGKHIPDELNKQEFYNIMNHLADKKIVRVVSEPDETGVRRIICYQWDASKALFGYFVEKMNETMNIRGARVPLNWKVFRPAINNYDEIVEEARKALSTYNNSSNLQKNRIEKAEMVDEAIEYKELPF